MKQKKNVPQPKMLTSLELFSSSYHPSRFPVVLIVRSLSQYLAIAPLVPRDNDILVPPIPPLLLLLLLYQCHCNS